MNGSDGSKSKPLLHSSRLINALPHEDEFEVLREPKTCTLATLEG
jgi:hypothetical protein